jgi:hypothetical protein
MLTDIYGLPHFAIEVVFLKLDKTAVIYPACNELLALTLMTFARKHLINISAFTSALTVTRFDLRRSDQFTSTRFQCNLRRTPFLSSNSKQILMTKLLPTDTHSPLLTLPI